MNILVASVYSHNSYSRGIMPDVLQDQIDKFPGSKIYYLTNSNSFDICYFNIEKRPEVCYLCKTGVKNTLGLIEGKYEHIRISDIISPEDVKEAKAFFKNEKKITFDHTYNNFEVGAATLSTYISRTRDRELINVEQYFVKELAINALALYLATTRFLLEKNIEIIYNFNGRQDYVRAIMRACIATGKDCYNVERARLNGYVETYKNTLPHDIFEKKKHVDLCWEKATYTDKEKEQIGSSFFIRQRSGESVIFPSYLKHQKKNNLPKEIQNGNENIVLFNSSDDEFAALGEQFNNPLFEDQATGIKYLVELFGQEFPNKNLIIRMHPNLKEVTFKYVQDIRDQHQRFPNIFVILPESDVDSYALMDSAVKILTFGSTIGMEATYYRKPSILLGKSFYYFSNVAYTPKDKKELESLLHQKELQSLPLINALRFGYYYLQGGEKATYYDEVEIGEQVYFKNKIVHFYSSSQRYLYGFIKIIYQLFKVRLRF